MSDFSSTRFGSGSFSDVITEDPDPVEAVRIHQSRILLTKPKSKHIAEAERCRNFWKARLEKLKKLEKDPAKAARFKDEIDDSGRPLSEKIKIAEQEFEKRQNNLNALLPAK